MFPPSCQGRMRTFTSDLEMASVDESCLSTASIPIGRQWLFYMKHDIEWALSSMLALFIRNLPGSGEGLRTLSIVNKVSWRLGISKCC